MKAFASDLKQIFDGAESVFDLANRCRRARPEDDELWRAAYELQWCWPFFHKWVWIAERNWAGRARRCARCGAISIA